MKTSSIFTTNTVTLLVLTVILLVLGWQFLLRAEMGRLAAAAGQRDQTRLELAEVSQKKALLGQAESRYASIKQDLDKLSVAIPVDSQTGEYIAALQSVAGETGLVINSLGTTIHAKTVAADKSKGDQSGATKTTSDTKRAAAPAKTEEEELQKSFFSTSFDLRLTGSYESISAFLDRLQKLDRFSVISTVSLTAAPDKPDSIAAGVTLFIYHRTAAKEAPKT